MDSCGLQGDGIKWDVKAGISGLIHTVQFFRMDAKRGGE